AVSKSFPRRNSLNFFRRGVSVVNDSPGGCQSRYVTEPPREPRQRWMRCFVPRKARRDIHSQMLVRDMHSRALVRDMPLTRRDMQRRNRRLLTPEAFSPLAKSFGSDARRRNQRLLSHKAFAYGKSFPLRFLTPRAFVRDKKQK
ncbi:MAG: hypothetical protein IKD11_05265, partial [Oscillospiraceae bacterium]|nr:hypothetical protein [Oscillospiraceae bacterium]